MPHYRLAFADPSGHLLDIEMTLPSPAAGQLVAMPAWIPGSYLIRDFARHVVSLTAEQQGQPVHTEKADKASWRLHCALGAPVTLRYRVYAWDRSVRGCYFDASRGFVNPAACLLQDMAHPQAACTLDVVAPGFPEAAGWRCATSMSPADADSRGFGRYQAANYDELIDHPIECADFAEFTFEAGGVPHRFVLSGRHRGDLTRLRNDAQRICQGHCDLFSDRTPPFDRYVFLLHVVDDGYGGLEHRASTALISPRSDLPAAGDATVSEGYRDLLGLISHEYFHAWNVKRIKPAAFTPPLGYDTTRENYTRLLWLFEGFTSYYDDLMLKRVGLITDADYLRLLGRRLTQLLRTPGRLQQSVTDASFDAWIKYYRADENAVNSQFSYYLRGSFIALALDLMQRARDDAPTLDDLMRRLWRDFGQTGVGVPEDPLALFSTWAGCDLSEFFGCYIDGVDDPDWAALLAPMAVGYHTRASASAGDRGGRDEPGAEVNPRTLGLVLAESGGLAVVKHVLAGSAAWRAGLSAGDTLVALDGLRASGTTLSKHLARFQAGATLAISYFRHDVLASTEITVPAPAHDTVWLSLDQGDSAQLARRGRWLG